MPRIGKLRSQVTLQTNTQTRDAGGGYADSWAGTATLWARIEPLSGRERLAAQQIEDTVTHRVTIRYRSGVSAQQRIAFGVRVFNIRAVLDVDERNEWLELLCEEGVAT